MMMMMVVLRGDYERDMGYIVQTTLQSLYDLYNWKERMDIEDKSVFWGQDNG